MHAYNKFTAAYTLLVTQTIPFSPVINAFTPDIFPPEQIIDLQARQMNINDVDSGIVLTFTAPGDDANSGNGKLCAYIL